MDDEKKVILYVKILFGLIVVSALIGLGILFFIK